MQQLGEDVGILFQEALKRPGGALGRGPSRYYVEVHPERLRGFIDLMSHPWIRAVCETVLGPRWKLVEVGFDVPGPGAMNQPWHRDFPIPEETLRDRRLNSLAFNITTVDTTEDMGPFEIADRHDLQLTRKFHASLPDHIRRHLTYRVVDELEFIEQVHTIEGLVMGDA